MNSYGSGAQDTLYHEARKRARLAGARSFLTGEPRQLLSLTEFDATCKVQARRHAGLKTVPISQIRGSEGRCGDFDRYFNPLQTHTAGRWRSVATARASHKPLPPVDLIQIGDVYFVRDGHHRISVARTVGQRHIDADVIVWRVACPLPWEGETSGQSLAGQEVSIPSLYRKARNSSSRFRDQLLVSVGDRLIAAGRKLRARQASRAGASA